VWAWGANHFGQLGDGTETDSSTPVQVKGLTSVIAIDAAADRSVALESDGTVWVWGQSFALDGTPGVDEASYVPIRVEGLKDVAAIVTGSWGGVAIDRNAIVWQWTIRPKWMSKAGPPQRIECVRDVIALADGNDHVVALTRDGIAWAWGENADGQLGIGISSGSSMPVKVEGLTDIVAIDANVEFGPDYRYRGGSSVMVREDGTVWACGYNRFGQLGDGTTSNRNVPVQVKGLAGIVAITAGGSHSVAVDKDGRMWAWGDNSRGQLGDGSTTGRTTPVQVTGPKGAAATR
jgi:alpha-tubulin suppressor-like RCC1 family protein